MTAVKPPMIKYIGSKRRLVPVLTRICQASGARTALDLFTGTTRVAQAFKAQGVHVTAVDSARYAHTFARTYIEADAAATDAGALRAAVTHLNALPGKPGYVTETFSHQARFFQPHNAARIDAVRDAIDSEYAGSPLFPLLLTSLIEAADRVDSTTGVQMAYVKQWAPRSAKPLELRVPELLRRAGPRHPGRCRRADVRIRARDWGTSTWRTWIRRTTSTGISPTTTCGRRWWPGMRPRPTAWPASGSMPGTHPPTPSSTRSGRCRRRWRRWSQSVDCDLLVLSYNNESWLGLEELEAMCSIRAGRASGGATAGTGDEVATLAFDSARYVGARIGIFDPSGRKVGRVSHLSNQELLVIAGEPALVRHVVEAAEGVATGAASACYICCFIRRRTRGGRRRPGGSATTGNVSKHDHGGHDSTQTTAPTTATTTAVPVAQRALRVRTRHATLTGRIHGWRTATSR